MPSMQTKTTIDTRGWDIGGDFDFTDSAVVAQDAGRGAADMLFLTLMSKITSSQKLVPLTDVTAVDGSAFPFGLLGIDIDAADIVAGDVTAVKVITKGHPKKIDEDKVVFEGAITAATVITAVAEKPITVRDYMRDNLDIELVPTSNTEFVAPIT